VRVSEVGESRPVLGVLHLARDVVEQQGEPPNPKRGHGRQLPGQSLDVVGVRVADGQAGTDAVHEVDPLAAAAIEELSEAPEVITRVQLAPRAAYQWIVLRGVDEGVHAVCREEVDQVQALLARPRVAVEPLDDPTHGEGRARHTDACTRHRPSPRGPYRALAASPPSTLLLV
jgi:hypothetical protein